MNDRDGAVEEGCDLSMDFNPSFSNEYFTEEQDINTTILSRNDIPYNSYHMIPTDSVLKDGFNETTLKPDTEHRRNSRKSLLSKSERQKSYRKRMNEMKRSVQDQLEATKVELQALQDEKEQLQIEHSALQSIQQYSDLIFNTLVSLKHAASRQYKELGLWCPNTATALVIEFSETFWNALWRPTDDQLLRMASNEAVVKVVNSRFSRNLCKTIIQWCSDASPTTRALCENKLKHVFNNRRRVLQLLLKEDPSKAAKMLFSLSLTPQHDILTAAKDCLSSPHLLKATRFSEEQRNVLTRHWRVYCSKYKSTVDRAEAKVERVNVNTLTQVPTSMQEAAKQQMRVEQIIPDLQEFVSGELIARMELLLSSWQVLTPLQQAYLMIAYMPSTNFWTMFEAVHRLNHNEDMPYTTEENMSHFPDYFSALI